MIENIVWFFVFLLYAIAGFYWFWSFIKGAPFYPSNKKAILDITSTFNGLENLDILELGSGDGRVAIALSKQGARSVTAIDINPLLTMISRARIAINRIKNIKVIHNDILKIDYSKHNAAVVYLFPGLMEKIESKLFTELPKGSQIISNTFRFKNHTPTKIIDNRILLYIVE
jgi:16S rRNA A1518/A1519 N6-dimethyltransferase RsmA/KsgA/DIM1 with predicted DNA glycosylase/AP lyase activity